MQIKQEKIQEKTTYSVSRLNTFLNCPLKYDLSYNQGFYDLNQIIPSATYKGIVFHELAEERALRELAKTRVISDKFVEEIIAKSDKKRLGEIEFRKASLGFLNWWKSNKINSNSYEIIPEKTQYWSIGEVNMTGIVDLILIDNDTKNITVIDYKTSKSMNMDWHKLQLLSYAFFIKQNYNINLSDLQDKVSLQILYPYVDKDNLQTLEFKTSDLSEHRVYVESLVDEIESTKKFHASPNFLCKFCIFQGNPEYCEMSTILGNHIDPNVKIGQRKRR